MRKPRMRRSPNLARRYKTFTPRTSPTAAFPEVTERLRILPDIPGVDFDAAWERRVESVIDPTSGLKANFISAGDLITAKLAAGRPQDIADADAIRKAADRQGPQPQKKGLRTDAGERHSGLANSFHERTARACISTRSVAFVDRPI